MEFESYQALGLVSGILFSKAWAVEISSQWVGAKFRSLTIEVTPRRIMNFSAGIFDGSSVYFDDRQPTPLVAHPMLACGLTWPLSDNFAEYLEAPDFPQQVRSRQVHYSESLQWHRAIQAGDWLNLTGQIAAIIPHRSGTHLVVRYDAYDRQGQPVFTEFTGAMLRGVQCLDEGRGQESLPVWQPLNTGSALWRSPISVHPLAAHLYDGCSEISFPIHTSVAFAQSVGLPGIILQGTASVSYAVSQLIQTDAAQAPGRVSQMDCRFTGMVFPGSEIFLELCQRQPTVDGIDLFWRLVDDRDRPLVSDGRLRISAE
jgi:acyl dehydratase